MSEQTIQNILFICSANKDRSATAADYFSGKYSNFSFDAAGTNEKICLQLGTTFVTEEQVSWADTIFVMEVKHRKFILTNFNGNHSRKIRVLTIPDHFSYFQKELIQLLEYKLMHAFRQ